MRNNSGDIYNKLAETMTRNEMRGLQLDRLKKIVKYAYKNVPFYKKQFDDIGLKPSDIETLKDIEKIPFTQKSHFRDNYPYGLLAVPQSKIVRVHASSGTSGKPTVVCYTKNDLDMWSECVARLASAAGCSDKDVVQVCFGYGLFTGGFGLHYGLERLGASVIPASSGNSERQLMLMKDLGATVIVGTPSYALYLGELAERLGYKKDDLKLKTGLFGSEASTPEMMRLIENKLGLRATNNYGLSEIVGPGVSGDCLEDCGMHINEDHFYAEIIDSQSGEIKGEGEYGELVLTTLTKEGMPILRYKTRDITRLDYSPCKCGRTTARMDRIKGRVDDMLIIRGVNVFPSQIESVLMAMKEAAGHYEIVVRRENFMDVLEVSVELNDASLLDNYGDLEALRQRIRHNLKTVLQIDTVVKLVQPMSLTRYEGKAKRVVDERK
ncbi:MAG: phenylacetate--CoA ligase [Clostridiales bacterium]|jgi:phenylacetate-CoA ligase|nr:phenylacetate--CoA ligase [Clostridiales bacterium]